MKIFTIILLCFVSFLEASSLLTRRNLEQTGPIYRHVPGESEAQAVSTTCTCAVKEHRDQILEMILALAIGIVIGIILFAIYNKCRTRRAQESPDASAESLEQTNETSQPSAEAPSLAPGFGAAKTIQIKISDIETEGNEASYV